jgi:hypothetical protein
MCHGPYVALTVTIHKKSLLPKIMDQKDGKRGRFSTQFRVGISARKALNYNAYDGHK